MLAKFNDLEKSWNKLKQNFKRKYFLNLSFTISAIAKKINVKLDFTPLKDKERIKKQQIIFDKLWNHCAY